MKSRIADPAKVDSELTSKKIRIQIRIGQSGKNVSWSGSDRQEKTYRGPDRTVRNKRIRICNPDKKLSKNLIYDEIYISILLIQRSYRDCSLILDHFGPIWNTIKSAIAATRLQKLEKMEKITVTPPM